jgi:hypothetical protein
MKTTAQPRGPQHESAAPSAAEEDLESQIESIQNDLAEAQKAEAGAQADHAHAAGRAVLGESSIHEVAAASEAWRAAQARTAATRAALNILTERQKDRKAREEAARLADLREEADSANSSAEAARRAVVTLTLDMQGALADLDNESVLMADTHSTLRSAQPEQAAQTDAEYQGELDRIAGTYEQRRVSVREEAGRARYSLQRSDGTDPMLDNDLILQGELVASKGQQHSEALPHITDWELSALASLDDGERAAQRSAYEDHRQHVHDAGLGWLPSPSPVELDVETVARLLSGETKRALAGLFSCLPASSWEGIAVREIRPKDAVSAVRRERQLEEGRAALKVLAN